MKLLSAAQRSLVLFSFLLIHQQVDATVTINLGASSLDQVNGVPMPVTGLVLLVASTTDSTFGGPTASAFVTGDDVEVARWDLSADNIPGLINNTTIATLTGAFGAGDPLAIYWFPTLDISAVAPGGGTTYGFYRDPGADSSATLDGSDPWVTPADGSTVGLLFLTADGLVGGSNPASAGDATSAVNQVPVALADTFSRHADIPLKIGVADVLANDSDPDADPVTLLSVDTISTNGVTITWDSLKIYYTAPAGSGYNVTDQFSYTISDGNGGEASAVVTINVDTTNSSPSHNITDMTFSNGIPTISFAGVPSQTYYIEAATNLSSPIWITIGTNTADALGRFSFTDENALSFPERYYRSFAP